MAVPINNLRAVQTYQESALAYLTNLSCFFDPRVVNTKFKDFENFTGQLGDTVTYSKPFRYVAQDTLTVTYQSSTMRQESLTVDKAKNISPAFTAEQFVFTVDKYMDEIGMAGVQELGAVIEKDVASTIVDNTYRFYGDGTTSINSFNQLALAMAYFRNYGSANNNYVGIIDDISQANIVGSGLSQFTLDRNNELAMSWELGKFANTDWFVSNLLPTHTAGYCGLNNTQLTFSSISADGTQITFTHSAGVQSDFFKEGDLLYFETDVRYLTFVGHAPSQNAVQVRITADADSASGTVVANVYPALIFSSTNPEANLSRALAGTDTARVITSHRAGVIMSGKPFYLAMPRLPSTDPFPSAQSIDPTTGISLRMYHGEVFGQNQRALVHDVIWGKMLTPEYAMRLCFPIY